MADVKVPKIKETPKWRRVSNEDYERLQESKSYVDNYEKIVAENKSLRDQQSKELRNANEADELRKEIQDLKDKLATSARENIRLNNLTSSLVTDKVALSAKVNELEARSFWSFLKFW
jgi:DNA repair exonuclease SbcCD ATPase subunit